MIKLTHSLGAKISAVMVWTVMMLGAIGGAIAGIFLQQMGFYGSNGGEIYWPFGYEYQGEVVFGVMEEGMIPIHNGLYHFCWAARYGVVLVAIICAVAAVMLLVFLCCSAGHQPGQEEAVPNGIDRIPLDLFAAGLFTAVCFLINIMEWTFWIAGSLGSIVVTGIWIVAYSLIGLLFLMTVATRYKIGTLWSNNIIAWVLKFIGKIIVDVFEGTVDICRGIPLIWKTILLTTGISLIEFLGIAALYYEPDNYMGFWIIEKLILIPIVWLQVLAMKKLQAGGEKLAGGQLDYRVNTKRMFWDYKKHGENLNSISEGMNRAVEEKLKSERFKTELITNVSHDIKTPLTSIINYVDLIKKEDLQNETAAEYVEVLDRQSKRLKKLIEDLVEASKASTGNISVDMQKTSIGVVLTQAAGEYEDRMNDKHLELILNQPQEEVYIMADGRLLWRVFDNLLSNICKYAQSGTRVYLNLDRTDSRAVVTFRNISAYPLNMTSEELMERFTRGDSSRHTEGSGLGLSIAKSLTELQKGEMDLYTDGDLFKVVLSFGRIGEEQIPRDV